ncbi:MAG: cupin domain-containing protein [Immundisolibacter sp.]|uniref:cupin domain-containing protein n=1 Tax=Immundisolibacter sp. TaxID=1934948 RepID=UPI003EDF84B3
MLYTAKNCQLVSVALKPQEEIGAEVHKLDQFSRVEERSREAVLDGVRTSIRTGSAVLVTRGTKHNMVKTSSASLKLCTLNAPFTLDAPPIRRNGVVHHTRADAEADSEHFEGETSE